MRHKLNGTFAYRPIMICPDDLHRRIAIFRWFFDAWRFLVFEIIR